MTVSDKKAEKVILDTVAYFDIFSYPLTLIEIWKWLFFREADSLFISLNKIEEIIKNSEAIKNSEIKGIKSFDGNYYIIETGLLEKYIPIVSETIQKNKNISLEELYKKAGINKILAKIICEFLKEEGDLIEKTKGRYTYV